MGYSKIPKLNLSKVNRRKCKIFYKKNKLVEKFCTSKILYQGFTYDF